MTDKQKSVPLKESVSETFRTRTNDLVDKLRRKKNPPSLSSEAQPPFATEALRAYARMMNTLDHSHFEPLLANDFCYASQKVFEELDSKQRFFDYVRQKLQAIKAANTTVYAEMGTIDAYGVKQPCVVLAQNDKDNLVAIVLCKVESNRVKRLDLCVVPPPHEAVRTGEYPR